MEIRKEARKNNTAKTIKTVLEILFFFALTVFSVYYILKDDPIATFSAMSKVYFLPLAGAILAVLLTIVLDGISLTRLSRMYNGKYRYSQGIVNVMIGGMVSVYVKSAATIIQAYTFTKQEIKSAQAASVLTMNYLMAQLTLVIYSLVILIIGYPVMSNVPLTFLGGLSLSVISILSLIVQTLILLAIIMIANFRPLHRFVLNTGINFLAKLHILKKPEDTRRRFTLQFATYRIEMRRLFQNIPLMIQVFLCNLLKQFVSGTIPFIILLALGMSTSEISFYETISGAGYISMVSSLINVGAPEICFQSTMSYIIRNASVSSAHIVSACNMLWRLVTFYLVFLIGVISFLTYKGAPKHYEILTNTATIYDLEIDNIIASDVFLTDVREDGSHKKSTLLTDEEIDESFRRIRESMEIRDMETITGYAPMKTEDEKEQERKSVLASAARDVEELEKKNQPDAEIMNEAEHEMKIQKEKTDRREEKRRKKEEEKAKKLFLKMQPKGAVIIEDENGIHINSPEIIEIRTYTTSAEEEKED